MESPAKDRGSGKAQRSQGERVWKSTAWTQGKGKAKRLRGVGLQKLVLINLDFMPSTLS